nr:MAG TPA: hypothetical protein [Bacteriophage sp.]DAR48718.1 MAG TPA: hypothetical protein [Bacteriophage sp.]DAT53757.1 MAG TPA: hypothetical protein [Bacteriophage sp.]
MFNNGVSLADIAAVTGNNRNNDGMWGDGAWWIVILLIFGWGGFGGNGWGGNGAGNGYTDAAIQRGFDNQTVVSKLDGISNGICNLGYDQLAQMNGINTNILQTGFGIQQAINADTVSGMQNTNAIQSTLTNMAAQNASCCCETQRQIERGFADTNYNMATQACQTRQAIADSTRSILDYLCQDKIATLQAENNDLRHAASQDRQNALLTTAMAAQTNQIINSVNPTAIPAYVVPNPNAYAYGCGCNQSCGC